MLLCFTVFRFGVGKNVGKVLTDTQARKISPGSKPLCDAAVKGLRLKPSETKGRGYWELRFTSPTFNKRRDMGLGTYPEVSIAAARKLATEAWELIAKHVDPLSHRELEASTRKLDTPTFEQAAWNRSSEPSASLRWASTFILSTDFPRDSFSCCSHRWSKGNGTARSWRV